MKLIILLFIVICYSSFCIAQTKHWKITWDKNPEDDISEYVVYKGTTPNITKEIARVKNPKTTFIDKNITPGILYYYRIKAINDKGVSSNYSDVASAAIPEFKNLPMIIGISKDEPAQLLLNDFINDPDDTKHEIHLIDKKGDSKLTVELQGGTLIIKARNNWIESDTNSVMIEVIDSDGFYNITKILAKDASLLEGESTIVSAGTEQNNININPEEFMLSQYSEIIFSNIPKNSDIEIYDSFGNLVFSEEDINKSFSWDAENNNGDQVLFGLYNYKIYNNLGNIITGGSFRVLP